MQSLAIGIKTTYADILHKVHSSSACYRQADIVVSIRPFIHFFLLAYKIIIFFETWISEKYLT